MKCRGLGRHLAARGKSHGFSRIVAGMWSTFSCYRRYDPSKLMFVQGRRDSCLVTRDTSGISMRPGRAIQMLLKMRRETEDPFQLPQ